MKKMLCWSMAVLCLASTAFAETGVAPTIAARSQSANHIAVGRVMDVASRFEVNKFGDQLIVSSVLVEVSETLKGSPASLIRVDVEGGTVGGLTLKVSDMPALHAGDRALFFLDAESRGSRKPHDRGRGIVRLLSGDRVEGTTDTLEAVRDRIQTAVSRGGR